MPDPQQLKQTVKIVLDTTELESQFATLKATIEQHAQQYEQLLKIRVSADLGTSGPTMPGGYPQGRQGENQTEPTFPQLGVGYPGRPTLPPQIPVVPSIPSPSPVLPPTPSMPPMPSPNYPVLPQLPTHQNNNSVPMSNMDAVGYTRQVLAGMTTSEPYRDVFDMISPFLSKSYQSLTHATHGNELYTLQQASRLSNRARSMSERVLYGGSVTRRQVEPLRDQLLDIHHMLNEQQTDYMDKHDLESMNANAMKLTSVMGSYQTMPDDQRERYKDEIKSVQASLDKLGSEFKTIETRDMAISRVETSLNTLPDPAQSPWHISPYIEQGRSALSRMLPMYGMLLGAGALGASYSYASQLGINAGQVGMAAGGANPNLVYQTAQTQGAALGFSPSQEMSAMQMQGQFSGTGNIAFLFRDAQQTAQFARYIGVDQAAGAQLMGTYQLAGAFHPGQEAAAAAALAGATSISGTNSQMFVSGATQLAQSAMRTGIWSGAGPANSLALVNRLGSVAGMPLFQGSQGVTTLEQMQQGFAAGPGQASGMIAPELLPFYQAETKLNSAQLSKYGINSPVLQTAETLGTPFYSTTAGTEAMLRKAHNELSKLTPGTSPYEWLSMSMQQMMFGGPSMKAAQAVHEMSGPGFAKDLAKVTHDVMKAHGTAGTSEAQQQTTYLSSISQHAQKIQAKVEQVEASLGKMEVDLGSIVANMRTWVADGVVLGMAGFGLTKTLDTLMGGKLGNGIKTGINGLFKTGGKGGSITAAEEAASAGGDTALAGELGTLATIDGASGGTLTPIILALLAGGGAGALMGASLPSLINEWKQTNNGHGTPGLPGTVTGNVFGVPTVNATTDVTPAQMGHYSAMPNPLTSITGGPSGVMQYSKVINQDAKKYGVPASLLAGVMQTESRGNPYAINDNTTGSQIYEHSLSSYVQKLKQLEANGNSVDRGLMQFNSKWHPEVSNAQTANPQASIGAAAKLLVGLEKQYGTWDKAIAAYNSGSNINSAAAQQYQQNVFDSMSQFSGPKPRPSAKHNLNRKSKKARYG